MSDSARASHASAGPGRQTGETAGHEAAATAGEARHAAGEVRATAGHEARAVADTAREQAGSALGDLRDRARSEADSQVRRTADTVRQWADDLAGMAGNAREGSPARTMAEKASDGGHRAADFLEKRGAGGITEEIQSFARRKPGVFLGAAAAAGLAAGRIAKDLKSASSGTESGGEGTAADRTGPMRDRAAGAGGRTGPSGESPAPSRGTRPETRDPGVPGRTTAREADWPGLPGRPPEVG
ncbi:MULTISPECIES: hypothetical protein [Streptomyces]|uniref:hypothetical protein n=1 Tax=Streptomyces TaxID=1883 RepID=UPI0004D8213C|nr:MULTISPECIES: hypothetical protein [Streptomyces]